MTLYISMIRAEKNYSRLTVEEIIWKRERETETDRRTNRQKDRQTVTEIYKTVGFPQFLVTFNNNYHMCNKNDIH